MYMKNHVRLARKLRKTQTPAETLFWNLVKNKNLDIKFLRQHPIAVFVESKKKYFIADFYSSQLKLVIEIDGLIHNKQREYDEYRTELLQQKSLKILRFTNEEVLNDIARIKNTLKKLSQPFSFEKEKEESVSSED